MDYKASNCFKAAVNLGGDTVLTQYGGTFASTTIASLGDNTEGTSGVGVHTGYRLDNAGKLRNNPPTVGALEAA